jgi:RNA polymerase sigma-70 factor, ECF subfamily
MTTMVLTAPADFISVPQRQVRVVEAAAQTQVQRSSMVGVPLAGTLGARRQPALVPAQQEPGDEELISAICLGAEWAMETLYQRYHRYAYALAYRILRESTAAEDIVQEVFLSIWRKASSYQKRYGSVYSWLQAIVHHRAIDKVRSASYRDRQWTPLQTEGEQDPPSEQPDVWEVAWQQEQRQLIRSVLAQLPPEQRLVIEMAYFGGYTHAEISEQKNIPLGTVKGRMRLGLQKMKHLLQERGLDTAC